MILPASNGEISVNISEYWSDKYGTGVKGWISAAHGPPDDVEFVCHNVVVPVAAWHAREAEDRERGVCSTYFARK